MLAGSCLKPQEKEAPGRGVHQLSATVSLEWLKGKWLSLEELALSGKGYTFLNTLEAKGSLEVVQLVTS